MKSLSIPAKEKLEIIESLSTFLSSGIPILEAVDSLIEESRGNSKKILQELKEDLNQGKTLSYSLSRHPKAFDAVTTNLLKAAEEGGTLEATLKDLCESIQKDMDFLGNVKSSLVYPFLVFIILIAVIILNLFFVIPRISQVFSRLNVQIPWPTKVLIATSNFANNNLTLVIIITIVIIALLILIYKTKRSLLTSFFFSLPLISKLIVEIDIARFTRSMGLLLKSGIPITEALTLSRDIVGKKEMRSMIDDAIKNVSAGQTFSSSLRKFHKVIPSFMAHITEAGEKSGTLEKSMQELSIQFENRVSRRLKTLIVLIEPLLLVFVGIIVGAIMLAIIAPIYNLIGQINQR